MRDNDVSLIRMVISNLVLKHGWSYEIAIDKFYKSNVCKGLSDESTGIFTFSPREIIELFSLEIQEQEKVNRVF